MKSFPTTLNFLKNYFLQLSRTKKIFLSVIVAIILIFIYLRIQIPYSDINNALNSQTVISAINNGNINNKVIFESDDKKVEIENKASWFKNENGDTGSVVIIKDVGSTWKKKDFLLQIVGDGELDIKLSGLYAKFSDSPTIFVAYQNLTIDGKEIPVGFNDGRNDKDGLIFKIPVKNGQKIEMSFEYKNGSNWITILKHSCFLLIFLPVLLFFYFCNKVFNERQARTICKIILAFFIVMGVYFIMLAPTFGKIIFDEFWQIYPKTAVGNFFYFPRDYPFHLGRFAPSGFLLYNLLTLLPYGYVAEAHFMMNALIFALMFLFMAKILDFNSKQPTAQLYIKLIVLITFPFSMSELIMVFSSITLLDTLLCFWIIVFLLAYKKIFYGAYKSQNSIMSFGGFGDIESGKRWQYFWFSICVISMIFVSYHKEIASGIFLIIALLNILFTWHAMTKKFKIFNFLLVLNFIIYLALYYLYAFSKAGGLYAGAGHNLPFLLRIQPFIDIPSLNLILIFAIARGYFVLFKKDRQHIFYDGILFACIGYMIAYQILGLGLTHYFVIVALLFTPVLAYWLVIIYNKKKLFLSILLFVILINFCVNGISSIVRIIFDNAQYTFLKVDMLSKYNRQISIDIQSKNSYLSKTYIQVLTNYFNSGYFHPKSLDDTELKNINNNVIVIENIEQPQEINPKIIYLTDDKNLALNNKKFSDFILFGYLQIYGGEYCMFIHKDAL